MKRVIVVMVSMAMVSCLVLAGCKKASEKAAEKAIEAGMAKDGAKADVDVSGQQVTIKSKEGTTIVTGGKGAALPEGFPKDVYMYEGATIIGTVTTPEGFNLTMETSDASDKVLAAVKSKMTGFGWKEEMIMNQGSNSMVSYKKGDRTALVNINADKKGTHIVVTTVEKKG
jgi:hypothetical protein